MGNAIRRYLDENQKDIGKTKAQVLHTLLSFPIADLKCSEVISSDIAALARQLSDGRGASTVNNYISTLSGIFNIAKSAWNYDLDRNAMTDAQSACKALGLTEKSSNRNRRPTLEELDALLQHFTDRSDRRPNCADMVSVILFAIFSTRRQSEICNLLWSDLDVDDGVGLIRDMKHPGQTKRNDVLCDFPSRAIAITQQMPKTSDRVFPFNADTVSAAFTRACQFLEIDDLHFHDLRHEGISHYFELKMTIPMVAAISGHRSWQSLQRYAQIRKMGDKYENWVWLTKFGEKG